MKKETGNRLKELTAFNHRFVFGPIPGEKMGREMREQRCVPVRETTTDTLTRMFNKRSEASSVSGRRIRYHGDASFGRQNSEGFSWGLEIEDVVTLIWEHQSKSVLYIRGKNYSDELLRFWLFHTFFPLVLEMESHYRILHAAAVEIDGRTILFSAPSHGGKSTLLDYLSQQGYPLLSDDTLAIEHRKEGWYAVASYPFCRPFREVESLGFYHSNFVQEPKHLSAFFSLQRGKPDGKVQISETKGIHALKLMHESIFVIFNDMQKEYLSFFADMAREIPVYELTIPWDKERLDEVHAEIKSLVSDMPLRK